MNVHLFRSKDVDRDFYNQVFEFLILDDSSIILRQHQDAISFPDETLSWDEIFSRCNQLRQEMEIPCEEFVILLTSRPNENNWFSACDPSGQNNIFVHTSNWEYYVPCEGQYPVAYQVVENVLERLIYDDIEAIIKDAHEPPRGCIGDMCSWKADISLKLRTGDICDECLALLVEREVDPEIIRYALAIFDKVRAQVLFSQEYREDSRADDSVLPFPIAITRRKMICASEPLKKLLMLLDHFDSIVRTTVLMVGNIIHENDFESFCETQRLDSRPALGHWVSALRKLSQAQGEEGDGAIGLQMDFIERLRAIADFAEQETIVSLRNERRGHGYAHLSDNPYLSDFERLAPTIKEIEKVLLPILTRYRLCYVVRSSKVDTNTFDVIYQSLMGSHPDFAEDTIQVISTSTDTIPIGGRIYAYFKQKNRWYKLHPFIIYDTCPICMHNRVLLSDGKKFIDPYIGHRVQMPGC